MYEDDTDVKYDKISYDTGYDDGFNARDMHDEADLREFCDILKYELNLKSTIPELIYTMEYLKRRGFTLNRNHNI